jgi:hypothetical protein
MKNLYNPDGTISIEAQYLLPSRPDHVSPKEWNALLKAFKELLTQEELKEFQRLKSNERCKKYRRAHPDVVRKQRKTNYDSQYGINWRAKHPDKIKAYSKKRYHDNKNRLLEASKKWSKENPHKSQISNKKWVSDNPEAVALSRARSRAKNREYNNEYSKNWQKEKRKEDPTYRLMCSLRTRCYQTIKCLALGKKPVSTLEMCGCSFEQLKTHLESLFVEGMSWENYGKWVVDHVRPVCSFTAAEWQQVNHYTNLRPLWAPDNTRKSVADKQTSRYKQSSSS